MSTKFRGRGNVSRATNSFTPEGNDRVTVARVRERLSKMLFNRTLEAIPRDVPRLPPGMAILGNVGKNRKAIFRNNSLATLWALKNHNRVEAQSVANSEKSKPLWQSRTDVEPASSLGFHPLLADRGPPFARLVKGKRRLARFPSLDYGIDDAPC